MVDLSINLPASFLEDPDAIDRLCLQVPNHSPAFSGLIIEISGTDIVRRLDLLVDVAKQVRFRDIAGVDRAISARTGRR